MEWIRNSKDQNQIQQHVEPIISQGGEVNNDTIPNHENQLSVYEQNKYGNANGHTSSKKSGFMDATQVNDGMERIIFETQGNNSRFLHTFWANLEDIENNDEGDDIFVEDEYSELDLADSNYP